MLAYIAEINYSEVVLFRKLAAKKAQKAKKVFFFFFALCASLRLTILS
jgi:hypothetical protein